MEHVEMIEYYLRIVEINVSYRPILALYSGFYLRIVEINVSYRQIIAKMFGVLIYE